MWCVPRASRVVERQGRATHTEVEISHRIAADDLRDPPEGKASRVIGHDLNVHIPPAMCAYLVAIYKPLLELDLLVSLRPCHAEELIMYAYVLQNSPIVFPGLQSTTSNV